MSLEQSGKTRGGGESKSEDLPGPTSVLPAKPLIYER